MGHVDKDAGTSTRGSIGGGGRPDLRCAPCASLPSSVTGRSSSRRRRCPRRCGTPGSTRPWCIPDSTDDELSEVFFEELSRRADVPARSAHRGLVALRIDRRAVASERPDLVLVYGDTQLDARGGAPRSRRRCAACACRGRAPLRRPLDARGACPDRGRPHRRAPPLPRRALGRNASQRRRRRAGRGRRRRDGGRAQRFAPIARERIPAAARSRDATSSPRCTERRMYDRSGSHGSWTGSDGSTRSSFPAHPRTRASLAAGIATPLERRARRAARLPRVRLGGLTGPGAR